jgi:hypothetical protein
MFVFGTGGRIRQTPGKIDFSGLEFGERFVTTVRRTTRQAEKAESRLKGSIYSMK